MTNIEKLVNLGILGDIRQRLRAKGNNDKSKDDVINTKSTSELVGLWCG